MVEGTSGCQECGVKNCPIIISNDEHSIPLHIQVERPSPKDHVVISQCAICSAGPIHSTTHIYLSCPMHIGGIEIHTNSIYSLVKVIKHHWRGEEIIP